MVVNDEDEMDGTWKKFGSTVSNRKGMALEMLWDEKL